MRPIKRLFIKRQYSPLPATSSSSGLEVGNRIHGSYHWIYERILSGASLATVTYGVIGGPSNTLDVALAIILPLHSHIGLQTIVDDYLPKRKFGIGYNVAKGSLLLATGLAFYGAYRFNTENIGLSQAIKELWGSKTWYEAGRQEEYDED